MSVKDRDFPGRDRSIGLIGVPVGYGAGQAGSDLGVTAIRQAVIRGQRLVDHIAELGYVVKDFGDAKIVNPDKVAESEDNPKYLAEMLASCQNIANSVSEVLDSGFLPLIIGGDHSIAIGTLSGISSYFHNKGQEIGLIWFDAHADTNTPDTSPSGNIHGMPLATVLGKGNPELVNLHGFAPKINPKYCTHIGGRDLDLGEKRFIREMGLRDQFFTMSDIDNLGMRTCVEKAISIASKAPGGFAVTFDVDVIDPRFAPGSGTLVRGGITYREAHQALEMVAEHDGMRSFEIVEVNPLLDTGNLTVEVACELILSALGKTIL